MSLATYPPCVHLLPFLKDDPPKRLLDSVVVEIGPLGSDVGQAFRRPLHSGGYGVGGLRFQLGKQRAGVCERQVNSHEVVGDGQRRGCLLLVCNDGPQ